MTLNKCLVRFFLQYHFGATNVTKITHYTFKKNNTGQFKITFRL